MKLILNQSGTAWCCLLLVTTSSFALTGCSSQVGEAVATTSDNRMETVSESESALPGHAEKPAPAPANSASSGAADAPAPMKVAATKSNARNADLGEVKTFLETKPNFQADTSSAASQVKTEPAKPGGSKRQIGTE